MLLSLRMSGLFCSSALRHDSVAGPHLDGALTTPQAAYRQLNTFFFFFPFFFFLLLLFPSLCYPIYPINLLPIITSSSSASLSFTSSLPHSYVPPPPPLTSTQLHRQSSLSLALSKLTLFSTVHLPHSRSASFSQLFTPSLTHSLTPCSLQ